MILFVKLIPITYGDGFVFGKMADKKTWKFYNKYLEQLDKILSFKNE